MTKLTELKCRSTKPTAKPYKLADGLGLYMEVASNGSRYWRFRYSYGGKEKRLALGVYPEISLAEAREKTLDARKHIREGRDPAHLKRQQKLFLSENNQNTFEGISRAWFKHNRAKWSDGHAETILDRLEKGIFPRIGNLPINDITPRLLHKHLQDIQDKGANELARRLQQHASQIFAYAIATGSG